MLKETLERRNLPALKNCEEMLQILQSERYGFVPENPDDTSFTVEEK